MHRTIKRANPSPSGYSAVLADVFVPEEPCDPEPREGATDGPLGSGTLLQAAGLAV